LPIAFCLTWFRRAGDADPVAGLRWGIVAALPVTAGAAYWFQTSSRQAHWEAALAIVALALAIWFARRVWQGFPSPFRPDVEARLLPWSDVLHAATEPYGPDGVYGRYVSGLLFVVPIAAAVVTLLKARIPQRVAVKRRRPTVIGRQAAVGVAALIAVAIALMS